jgi:hypothetical protein
MRSQPMSPSPKAAIRPPSQHVRCRHHIGITPSHNLLTCTDVTRYGALCYRKRIWGQGGRAHVHSVSRA